MEPNCCLVHCDPVVSLFLLLNSFVKPDLLEKSRAVRQAQDERTFHIFYQILNGMEDKEKDDFLFLSADKYKFLSSGNMMVAGVNDTQEFIDTKEAMDIMGMSEDEKSG